MRLTLLTLLDDAPPVPAASTRWRVAGRRGPRLGALALAVAALLVACDLLGPPANVAPTASFTVTPPAGPEPLTVTVDAGASSDADGTITSFAWVVTGPVGAGDTGETTQFTFTEVGTYTIALTVTDDDGASGSASREVRVGLDNLPPVARFSATPTAGAAPLTVNVDAAASSDPDGTVAGYAWATDDGQTATGVTAAFDFAVAGAHAIVLTVTDDDGASDQDTQVVTVQFPAARPGFQIDLLYADPTAFSSAERRAFEDAAARWSEVITSDLAGDSVPSMPANFCGGGENAVEAMPVDDLIIQVMLAPIDGAFDVVAFAGPCRLRVGGADAGLTKYGIMVFDSDDAARMSDAGTLAGTVLHEMGHVLGLGTLWQNADVLAWQPAAEPCETTTFTTLPDYVGANGKAGYIEAGAAGDVPVEEDGGLGTRCGHWDEGYLDAEVMTGWIEAEGTAMPLSRVTAGSLLDLGYGVSLAATDAYALPACAPACANLRSQGLDEAIGEVLIRPFEGDLR